MRHLLLILTASFLLSPLAAKAQETHWEVSLGAEYMLTAYSFRSPDNIFCGSVEATWWYRFVGDEDWVRLRRNPSMGIMADVGISPHSICGYRFGMAGMLRTPLASWLDGELGLGLSTFSKPLNRTGDTNNVYISTSLTCLVVLGLTARLDENIRLSLALLHASNGAVKFPNRGLNYFRLAASYSLPVKHVATEKEPLRPATRFSGYHEVGFMVAPSLVASRHSVQKGLFPTYNLSLNYQYHRSPVFSVGGSVDLWYNFSHTQQLVWYHDDYPLPLYVSALFFVEGFWGPVSIKGGAGVVLSASSRVNIPVYERLAAYYNFGNNYVGIGINAHAGQAEFVEWSYGFRFPIRKRR